MKPLRHVLIVLALLWSAPAWAVQPDEVLSDPALEARARVLSKELRCMVCQNQSIDDSAAPLARDLRLLVRRRLTGGDSDQQVLHFLVARYRESVVLMHFVLKSRSHRHARERYPGPKSARCPRAPSCSAGRRCRTGGGRLVCRLRFQLEFKPHARPGGPCPGPAAAGRVRRHRREGEARRRLGSRQDGWRPENDGIRRRLALPQGLPDGSVLPTGRRAG